MLTMNLYEHGIFFGKPWLGGNYAKFYIWLQSKARTSAVTLDTGQLFLYENLKLLFWII